MSTQKPTPAGGKTPRVHHPGPAGAGGTPGGTPTVQGGPQDEPYTPADYNNPAINDFRDGQLPATVIYDGEQPKPAPKTPQPLPYPPIPAEQAARNATDRVYAGLTSKLDDFWPGVKAEAQLRFLMDGLEPGAVKIDLPFNSTQICDGGLAVIKTIQSVGKKADVMQVDPLSLGRNIAVVLRIRNALEYVAWIHQVLLANESVWLSQVAETVDQGLKVGASVIAADGDMSIMLKPALAIRKVPADTALATKAANARLVDETLAKEQAKQKLAGTPPAASTASDTTKK